MINSIPLPLIPQNASSEQKLFYEGVLQVLRDLRKETSEQSPMTTLGDLIVGGVNGIPGRLGLGAANKKLFVNAAGDGIVYDTGIYQNYFTRDTASGSGSMDINTVSFR